MTTIPDCLAAFSVAAMMNSNDAASKAKQAIAAYLGCAPPEPPRQLAALHELYAAYRELALDSAAATEIKKDIERRIIDLQILPPDVIMPDRHA